jgi:hypothetical protein
MKRLLERLHHVEDYVLVIVLPDSGEIQVRRKPALAANEHFPQTGAALESQSVEDVSFGQQLKQERQNYSFSAIMMSRRPDSVE